MKKYLWFLKALFCLGIILSAVSLTLAQEQDGETLAQESRSQQEESVVSDADQQRPVVAQPEDAAVTEPSPTPATQVSGNSGDGQVPVAPAPEPPKKRTLDEFVGAIRQAKDNKKFTEVYTLADQASAQFSKEAVQQQKTLSDFPSADQINNYSILNNVALCLFMKGEALKEEGKKNEAVAVFQDVISQYPLSQAWDPRGWFYRLAEVSQDAINNIKQPGYDPHVRACGKIPATKIELSDPGTEEIVDYVKHGEFSGVDTADYQYKIRDQVSLSKAVGEGIYPNTLSVRKNPLFTTLKKEKRLDGSHWDFVHSPDLQAAFFKWTMAPEPPGIRLFYSALILENSGLIKHAIKAYYAIVVHYPQTVGWTYWKTPWYVGPASIGRIRYLCKKYPNVNMRLEDAFIEVVNGYDSVASNDVFVVNPGRLVKGPPPETMSDRFKKYLERRKTMGQIRTQRGTGKVRFVQYENGDWQLLVDGKPYVMKGITYAPVKVGQSPDDGSLKNWMEYDYNKNNKCDGPYDSFVDANGNGIQDKNEPTVGDFELMKRMGVNTIRLYHQPFAIDKKILRDMYQRYGIRVIMGDFLGKYALGSGASWFEGTDYDNPKHQQTMLESVRKMVQEYKDEPFLLMWLIGNENVYGVACNADKKPASFFKFANEAAKLIKSLDPEHPVAIANGDALHLDVYAQHAPDIDLFGANLYRGEGGFQSFWKNVKNLTGRPAFVTEYGSPAYVYCKTNEEAEQLQSDYLVSCWEDIMENSAFEAGAGNAIGGILFEWLDEWWKGYEPAIHDTKGLWIGPFPDGYMHEEWLGVCGQGDGKQSPFLRQLRKSYFSYQKIWRKKSP